MIGRLSPLDSPFGHSKTIAAYHLKVARTLLTDVEGIVHATIVCLPSFQNEWAIRLHADSLAEPRLTLTSVKSRLWETQHAEVSAWTKPFPHELSDRFLGVLRTELLATHWLERRLGMDGANYHFHATHPLRGALGGQTWSPDVESAPGHLVELANSIRDFVSSKPDASAASLEAISRELKWLSNPRSNEMRSKGDVQDIVDAIQKLLRHLDQGQATELETAAMIAELIERQRGTNFTGLWTMLQSVPDEVRDLIVKIQSP